MTTLWESNFHAPQHLVLSTSAAVQQFLQETDGLLGGLNQELEHYVKEVVDCMFDQLPASETVDDYLQFLREQLGEILGDSSAIKFALALGKLAEAVYMQLQLSQAWNSQGVLWYKFDRLLGHDVVLRREYPSGYA